MTYHGVIERRLTGVWQTDEAYPAVDSEPLGRAADEMKHLFYQLGLFARRMDTCTEEI